MNVYRKILVGLLFVSILLLSWGEKPATGAAGLFQPPAGIHAKLASQAQRLAADLNVMGYEIVRGYYWLYTEAECPYSFQEMGSCYANNPAAPYINLAVQPWPDEFLDPATRLAFRPLQDVYISSFRFDPREAIVVLGVLPPPAAYFGFQSYAFTRQGDFKTESPTYQFIAENMPVMKDTFFTRVPNNQKRIQIFSSLSNSINHVVIERQSGAAYDQPRVFIITPDQRMDRVVRRALGKLAIPQEQIFTEPTPGNLRLGLDEASDDFINVIRYAMPDDGGDAGTPSDNWRNSPPLVVLRIRATRPGLPPIPYPPVNLEIRTASSELYLQNDLNSLVQAVAGRWGQACIDAACSNLAKAMTRLQLPPTNLVGPQCTEIGMNCLADTQDTTYQMSRSLPITHDVVYALAGTLGTQTGNASYVGLGLNKTMLKLGFGNLSEDQLEGTAGSYAAVVGNTDKFFLYFLARDCTDLDDLTGGHCYEISEETLPPCNDPTSKTCDNLGISLRDYIRPGTQRGPAALLKLPAVVITLPRP